jgi:O-antigen/teichoic acid export membrane protein
MTDKGKSTSLKQRAVSGVIWASLQNLSQAVITFIIGILLARTLMPADFGLIGMLFIFIVVSSAFVESGFGAALVQKQNNDQIDYNTVFLFNLITSVFFYCLLFLAAPLISSFYKQPHLTLLLRVLAFKLIIHAFTLVPNTILYKNLAFRQQTIANVSSISISGIIAVYAAFNGFGVWSLVIQQLLSALLLIPFLYWFCPWKPSKAFSISRLRPLFSYGSKLLGTSLLQRFFDNFYYLIIGRFYPAASLGYYSRAQQLEQAPTRILSWSVSQVTFPLFSEIQHDKKRLKQAARKAIALGAFVVFPALAGLAAISEPFVLVVLTDKWLPAVPYICLFCIIGMGTPLQIMNQNVLRSTGRSDLFLYVEIVSKILLLAFIFVTFRYGILIILFGQVLHTFIMWAVLAYISGKIIDYSPWRQFMDLAPIICISILMAATAYGIGTVLPSALLKLCTMPIVGVIIYLLLAKIFRLEIFHTALKILKDKMGYNT